MNGWRDAGESAASLGLTGHETFDIEGIDDKLASGFAEGYDVTVRFRRQDGSGGEFRAVIRIDTPQEVSYYRHGGILPFVVRQLLIGWEEPQSASRGLVAAPVVPSSNYSWSLRRIHASVAAGFRSCRDAASAPGSVGCMECTAGRLCGVLHTPYSCRVHEMHQGRL